MSRDHDAPIEYTAGNDDDGRRLDRVVRRMLATVPLTAVYAAIRTGKVRVNGRRKRGDARIATGDVIAIDRRFARDLDRPKPEPRDSARRPKTGRTAIAPSDVVFENAHLVVMNKPAGVLTHGDDSLADSVELYLRDKMRDSLSFRPGPLHRLDRNTSGIVVFSKSLLGAQRFTEELGLNLIRKEYIAVLEGAIETATVWTERIDRDRTNRVSYAAVEGYDALTEVFPIARCAGLTLAGIVIATGRTHQIRAHAAHHGAPLAGDVKYGGRSSTSGYLLHAVRLVRERYVAAGSEDVIGFTQVVAPLCDAAIARLVRSFGRTTIETVKRRYTGVIQE